MAFPVVQDADTQSGVQASNATSWTGTYPTNLVSGDLILILVGVDGGALATATGFTGGGVPEGSVALRALAKVSDGAETGTFTITMDASEQGCWRTLRITGWEGTLAAGLSWSDLAGGWPSRTSPPGATGSGTAPDPGALNPEPWATEDTLWIAAAASDHGNTTYTGFPTNYTNTSAQESGGATGAALGTARRENAVASEDPAAFTTDASEGWGAVTIAIRPAAGGVTVTPSTAALVTTKFAPTVSTPRLVTPATASLTTATFAPAVSLGIRVTPATVALTLSTFAPTVSATANVVVTPGVASLVTATFAPTVAAPRLVTPGVAALSLTVFAPTVAAPRLVTPATASLTTTAFAPTVATPRLVTPPTAALTLATFAPTVTGGAGITVTPGTAALTLTAFAPTVTAGAGVTVTPSTAALSLTAFAPTVTAGADITVVPGVASLTLSSFAPTVLAPRLVTPATASLNLAVFAPTVVLTDHKVVIPTTAALALTLFPPTVAAPRLVTPATLALTLAAFAPTVTGTGITVTPGTAALVLATFAPTMYASSGIPPRASSDLLDLRGAASHSLPSGSGHVSVPVAIASHSVPRS